VEACDVLRAVLPVSGFFVLEGCVHLVISGPLSPAERNQGAEYGLAAALIISRRDPGRRMGEREWVRRPAPAATTEFGEVIVMLVIIIFQLSRLTPPLLAE
jgi:hypothetical protein